jgi:hypothetical protein
MTIENSNIIRENVDASIRGCQASPEMNGAGGERQ